jgi:hypothetical protein
VCGVRAEGEKGAFVDEETDISATGYFNRESVSQSVLWHIFRNYTIDRLLYSVVELYAVMFNSLISLEFI